MRKGTIWGRWYSKIMIMSNLLSTDVVVSCEYGHKHRADYTIVHYKVHVIICTILCCTLQTVSFLIAGHVLT